MSLLAERKPLVRASVLSLFLGFGLGISGLSSAQASTTTSTTSTTSTAAARCVGIAAVSRVSYTGVRSDGTKVVYGDQKLTGTLANTTRINRDLNRGALTTTNRIRPGDTVTATFTRAPGCASTPFGIASYRTLTSPRQAASYADFLAGQTLYASATTATGTSLTVKVPTVRGGTTTTSGCTNPHLADDQTYNGNGGDSASGNQYASTCDGSPSGNGNGTSTTSSKPCAGCVGNADNKNPPGQAQNGSDPNAGYECDTNSGVGKTNPAHSGCAGGDFQFDLSTGPVLTSLSATNDYFGPEHNPPGPSISYAWNVG